MINVNYVRNLTQEIKSDKKLEKSTTSTEKIDKSFKDVLEVKNKVNSNESNHVESKTAQSKAMDAKELKNTEVEPQEVAKDIVNKLDSLTEKLDAGVDEQAIAEELLSLLTLLNINTVEVKSLPIEIKLDTTENFADGTLNTSNKLINLLELANFSGQDSKLSTLVKDNSLTELSELILKILSSDENTVVSKIIPLIKDEDGKELSKEDIVAAIKSRIVSITNNTEETSNKESKVDEVKVINKEQIPTMVAVKEKTEVTENKLVVPGDSLTEEDKVLNKLLGDDTKGFSSLLNRFEAKSSIVNTTSTEGTPVFKETMDKDIIKNIKFMVRNTIQELKVKIYPKELGELTIKILSEEGIMRAEIKATSKETYNLLNSNMNEIKKALSNENIKIQEVNIGLYSEDTTYFSGQGFEGKAEDNREQGTNSTMGFNNEGEEIIEEATNDSNVDLLA